MNAPLDKRDLMAGLEQFEKHLRRSGVTIQGKDGALANFPPLVARREEPRQSVVEPQGPRSVEARQNDGNPAKRENLQKPRSVLRTDFAAIEAESKDARRHTARAESLGAATSNALPNPTVGLKPQHQKVETVASDPVGVANERVVSRRSPYVMAGIVMVGLAGLGVGMAFWNNASNSTDASTIGAEIELAKPPSQGATSSDIPAQQASTLGSSVSPPPVIAGSDPEQSVDASRPPIKTQSAIAQHGEAGLANQAASAPISPIPTQMQAEPVDMAALPEPRKAETVSPAPSEVALRPSDVPAQATAGSLPSRSPVVVAPATAPKAVARARKTPKSSVVSKLDDRRQPGPIAKPAKATVAESAAKPNSTQSPISETEAPAPKPAVAPESNGAFTYLQRAQQAVGSLTGVVRNLVGMDGGPRP
jgi:hypothetical protein